jgi:uncharacterized SAM-binding protein YcdF (DUF218 family)
MFFVLSKTVGYLCYPLSILFVCLLLFVAWRQRRPRLAWTLFWIGFTVLYFTSTPWGSDLLLLPLEQPYEHPAPPTRADAILVLGGALDLGGSTAQHVEYTQAADRFISGVLLAKRFPRATLIFAGGTADLVDTSKTEASMLRAEAEKLGVPRARIRVDDRSRNTRENAVETRRILGQTGGRAVVVITSAFHMRRALGCLRKAGIEATPYGVDVRNHWGTRNLFGWAPQSSRLDDGTSAVREYVGLVIYRVRGYL